MFAPENARVPSAMAHLRRVPHGTDRRPTRVIADGPGLALRLAHLPCAHFAGRRPGVSRAFRRRRTRSRAKPCATSKKTQIRRALDNTLSIESASRASAELSAPSSDDRQLERGAQLAERSLAGSAGLGRGDRVSQGPGAVTRTRWKATGSRRPTPRRPGLFRDRIFNGDREVHMFWEAHEPRATGTIGPHKTPRSARSRPRPISRLVSGVFPVNNNEFFPLPGETNFQRAGSRDGARADARDGARRARRLGPIAATSIRRFRRRSRPSTLLPNRISTWRALPSLDTVSMEWSEAAKTACEARSARRLRGPVNSGTAIRTRLYLDAPLTAP